MMAGGWPMLVLLLLSIACGYLYTGGPLPLAYTGLSDLFVLIFFGWVGTGIVYFVGKQEHTRLNVSLLPTTWSLGHCTSCDQ